MGSTATLLLCRLGRFRLMWWRFSGSIPSCWLRSGPGMAGVADAYLGQTLAGRYRLISHLADGGFSHVFKTADQRSGALVAVKVLQPDAAVHPESAVEFDHEGELLEALGKSRNVVGLFDSGSSTITVTVKETPLPLLVSFHVMELADAALSELLPLRHEVDWADKLRLFRDVVAGIHQMHVKGMVHRDLKASNVLAVRHRDSKAHRQGLRSGTQPRPFPSASVWCGRVRGGPGRPQSRPARASVASGQHR